MSALPVVTDHAVTRYLQRVHGMGHLDDRYRSDRDRAAAGSAILGLTVDEVRDLVCPPRLHRALALGDGIVKAHDRVLRSVGGRIVTCLEPTARPRNQLPREACEVAA